MQISSEAEKVEKKHSFADLNSKLAIFHAFEMQRDFLVFQKLMRFARFFSHCTIFLSLKSWL